ncbi:MAG TPA: T9SS type A sorting domain-containing protein, partial [Candidatus Cloacimonetes bacterium]|nr:T9SS type A sorting domain-containing protein [Candidatus Cloacimonadota bacterium]
EGTNTSEACTYTYLDKELEQSGTYYYWLQNVEMDGYTSYHGPVSVTFSAEDGGGTPDIPFVTKLENAYPNPFNPNTNIRYQLKEAGDVKIDIFNARGQLVRSFSRTHDAAGYYQINWDGRDSSGKAVSSGVYQYRMSSGKYRSTKKMVLKK